VLFSADVAETPSTGRTLGLLSVLPLYIALAIAVGFVDHYARVYRDQAYVNSAAIVHGTADPPARYRVLGPWIYDRLTKLTGLQAEDGWIVFRWTCLVGVFLAGHWYFRSWFSTGGAVAGNALIAALLPLTFTNSYGDPDTFIELLLLLLGCACIVRERMVLFLVVMLAAALNRETSFLLVIVSLCAGPIDRRRLTWAAAASAVWAVVYVGLRWRLGYAPYNPLQIEQNLRFLFRWPVEAVQNNLYKRLYAWFFVALLAPPIALIARSWSAQPLFIRRTTAIALPVFVAIGLVFSSVIEPRIFTPLLALVVPGMLFAMWPVARTTMLE
jgi:hypothetical protein